MKIKPIPKNFSFLDFSNPLKQNKDQIFKPKTLLKLVAKILLKMRKFALKIVS